MKKYILYIIAGCLMFGASAQVSTLEITDWSTTTYSLKNIGKITFNTPAGSANSTTMRIDMKDNSGFMHGNQHITDINISGVDLDFPEISGLSVSSGIIGTTLTITGLNFINVNDVRIGEVSGVYTVLSETTIEFTIPNGATSNSITVVTATGEAESATFSIDLTTATLFYDDFEDGANTWTTLSLGGALSEGSGLLRLDASNDFGADNNPFLTDIGAAIDISGDPIVSIKIKSSEGLWMTCDVADASGTKTIAQDAYGIIGDDQWHYIDFDFTSLFGKDGVDSTDIKSVMLFTRPGSGFTGTIEIDEIMVGAPLPRDLTPSVSFFDQGPYYAGQFVEFYGDNLQRVTDVQINGVSMLYAGYRRNLSAIVAYVPFGVSSGVVTFTYDGGSFVTSQQLLIHSNNHDLTGRCNDFSSDPSGNVNYWFSSSDEYGLSLSGEALEVQAMNVGPDFSAFNWYIEKPYYLVDIPKVRVDVSSDYNFTLRADLADFFGNRTNSNPVSIQVIGDGEYHVYEFDFTGKFFDNISNNPVDSTNIDNIYFYANPGSTAFTGGFLLDNLEIGECSGVGFEEEQAYELTGYPNPIEATYTIDLTLLNQPQIINVFNGRGHKVITQECTGSIQSLSFEGLSSGVYLIEVISNSGRYQKKVLKH